MIGSVCRMSWSHLLTNERKAWFWMLLRQSEARTLYHFGCLLRLFQRNTTRMGCGQSIPAFDYDKGRLSAMQSKMASFLSVSSMTSTRALTVHAVFHHHTQLCLRIAVCARLRSMRRLPTHNPPSLAVTFTARMASFPTRNLSLTMARV